MWRKTKQWCKKRENYYNKAVRLFGKFKNATINEKAKYLNI